MKANLSNDLFINETVFLSFYWHHCSQITEFSDHYSIWLDFPNCIINNENPLSRLAFATFEVNHTFLLRMGSSEKYFKSISRENFDFSL